MEVVQITEFSNVRFGNAQDVSAATGCTVILCPDGAVAGVDVRGGAPGTRETDLLRPENYVKEIHAVLLSGGSAFGLDAAGGVMQYLEEKGIGMDVGVAKVPIVSGAVLFDLPCGDARVRPDKAMGYQACVSAEAETFSTGSVGAGTGATVGKVFGMEHAMKGGLGSYCVKIGELLVGAVVAVNCLGDVIDSVTGQILAGAFQKDPFRFLNCEAGLLQQCETGGILFAGNTTIGVILTNAQLTKAQATKVASMAHDGYARTMRPAHTMLDGDTIFALSVGSVPADISAVGTLAAQVMGQAVISALKGATQLAGFLCYSEAQILAGHRGVFRNSSVDM
jgi:L-aminopeptidase/D-esterase-like protein